jgi:DNA-binding MarR family transcriptional regulator
VRSNDRTDGSIDQVASFIEYVSRLALSDRVQQRLAGAARVVTQSELAALRVVARTGPLTFSDLAERLRLDRTTVSRLAGRLHDLELIGREPDAADKRKVWLQATSEGRELIASLADVTRQYYEVATSDWTHEERAAAGEMLARLQDCLLRLQFDTDGRATGLAPRVDTSST